MNQPYRPEAGILSGSEDTVFDYRLIKWYCRSRAMVLYVFNMNSKL